MLLWILRLLGQLLVTLPEVFPRVLAAVLGTVIFHIPGRRRVLLSNLHHAFPDDSEARRREIARQSCRRTAETALFVLAAPQMSDAMLRRRFQLDPGFAERIRLNNAQPRPVVALVPHFSMMESLTLIPLLAGPMAIDIGVIYRPLDMPVLDRWARATRGRHGMKMLARSSGYNEAMGILRGKGTVAVLFDQNTGDRGILTTFMGRVASTTELPGLLSMRFHALNFAVFTERTGFWRGVVRMEDLGQPANSLDTPLRAGIWLEGMLRRKSYCADWLWLHDRWRNQDRPSRRFRLQAKKNVLAADQSFRGWSRLPRQTRFWIRMPNWLGDVVMALPLLRALRAGRPDAELTLLVQPHFADLLQSLGVADQVRALPARGVGYFRFFHRLRMCYPDTQVLFTQSPRSDLEAWCLGAPQRFGIARGGKRHLLTHCWKVPADTDENTIHQLRLWELFFRHFGLQEELPLMPFSLTPAAHTHTAAMRRGIGVICGTENAPEKRWPVSHWRALIESLPEDEPLYVFGTPADAPIAAAVTAGFNPDIVVNLAGKTSLRAFAEALQGIRVLVSNDTGGMHLANALGTPVIGLFGPTNPIRTGPVFDAPRTLLQAPGCPPTGGMPMDRISPQSVLQAVADI